MPISATNYDGSENYNVAEMGDICKPNLLDNSYFKQGIVNQKGQQTYNHTGSSYFYGIDRWKFNGNANLYVNDGYIKIQSTSGTCYFEQPLNIEKVLQEQCTMTVGVKAVSGTVKMYIKGKSQNAGTSLTGPGVFTATHTDCQSVFIDLSPGASIELYFIKLEEGDTFTGMPTYDVSSDIYKCLERYVKLANSSAYAFVHGGDLYLFFEVPVRMKKAGTITFDSNVGIVGGGQSYTYKDINVSSLSVVNINGSLIRAVVRGVSGFNEGQVYIIDVANLVVDANDY